MALPQPYEIMEVQYRDEDDNSISSVFEYIETLGTGSLNQSQLTVIIYRTI